MGLDVNLYARGPATDEQIATAERTLRALLTDTSIDPDWHLPEGVAWLRRDIDDDYNAIVELYTHSRHYGPSYPRGHWPDIYRAIRIMQAAFSPLPIHYGHDAAPAREVDEVELAATWRHWLDAHPEDTP